MKKVFLIFLLLTIFMTVIAHEYILLAFKYRVNKGDTLEMHLFVADGFNIQLERPFQKAITKKFELITGHFTTDLTTGMKDGTLPIATVKADFEGLGLFAMERDYDRIALPTKKFLEYIKEDHLENINGRVDLSKTVQKERYSRYIKCLVQSGKAINDTLYKTITGQNFEILLLQNPYLLHKGATLKAKILFMGEPLRGKIITAGNRTGSDPSTAVLSRTDNNGICSFLLTGKGEWFIHATHMIPCPDRNAADWESFWASYSFALD